MATLRVNGFRSACRARTAPRFAEVFSGDTLPGVQALANGVTETTSPGLDFRPQTCCVIKQDLTIVTFPIYPYSFDLSRIAGAKIREVGLLFVSGLLPVNKRRVRLGFVARSG